MNKTVMIILVLVVIIGGSTIGAFFWFSNLVKTMEEDQKKSATIAPAILNLFSNNQHVDEYPYEPSKPNWNGKFLILENRYSDKMSAMYSTKWNELLDTDKYFPGNDAKGVVMVAYVSNDEGTYDNHKTATRQSYVISYLDIAQQKVLARDTLRGEDPPATIRGTESGLGDLPDEDLVVNTIQKRLK